VHHVLVDGRQFVGQQCVQRLDDAFVALHGIAPFVLK
jgi:hypothetical protein